MTEVPLKSKIVVCETQPITAEGVRAILNACPDFDFVGAAHSLQSGMEMVRDLGPALVLADKALGMQGLAQWLVDLRSTGTPAAMVVWGISISEAEALRLVQAGARGVVRKSAEPGAVVACLRAVAAGSTWMEEGIFQKTPRVAHRSHSELTPREQQVLELVEHGLRNSDIARDLGIRPGTVKIHLKHIFEKTGVRGRYGLALSGLKEKGLLTLYV